MVLFHLFFLLCTIIRPRLRILTDLFLLFADDHSKKYIVLFHLFSFIYYFFSARLFDQKLGSSLVYLFYLYTTTWSKIRVLIDLFLLFAHNHSTKIYYYLSFIFSLCTSIRLKIIFYFFIYFSFLININLIEKNNYNLTITLHKLN